MNLEKQKMFADLKAELSELEKTLELERSKYLSEKRKSLSKQAFNDFEEFFKAKGFDVRRENDGIVADYKQNLEIKLEDTKNGDLTIITSEGNIFVRIGDSIPFDFYTASGTKEDAEISVLKDRIEKTRTRIELVKERKVYYWLNNKRIESFIDVLNEIFAG